MSSSHENENDDEFNVLLKDFEEHVISLELTDFEGTAFKHNSSGTSPEQYEEIKKMYETTDVLNIPLIAYDGIKFVLLRAIEDQKKAPFYVYISTSPDSDGVKRGLFITSFCSYALIATFDHKKINSTTSKIISILDQYQE